MAQEYGNQGDQPSDRKKKRTQMPEASAGHERSTKSREIVGKTIGESQEQASPRTRILQKLFDDSSEQIRIILSSPRAVSDVVPEGVDHLAEIVVRKRDIAGASRLRTLDVNLPTGSDTDPITVTRLFPGMLFGDATAATHLNHILQSEKEEVLADREKPPFTGRSAPSTPGLRKLVTHYATHDLSPEEIIKTYSVDRDHGVSLRLDYYHQARDVHDPESPIVEQSRNEITRAFMRDEEMSLHYAHEKAFEVFVLQQDDEGRRAVFDRFKQLDETAIPNRESFTHFRFTTRRVLEHPDLLTNEDADWIIESANRYKRAAEKDPSMEDGNMMAKYILPLEILIDQHKGVPVQELIERKRNGTESEAHGYPVSWIGTIAYHDEASFLQYMALLATRQGKFADAGELIAAIQSVVFPTSNGEIRLYHTQERQQALQDSLREVKTTADINWLRRGEDISCPELASLIQMKELLLHGDIDNAATQARQLIASITDENIFAESHVFDKKNAVDYCIREILSQDP